MPSYETSLAIAAPQQAVWNVHSAVADWPEWLPTVTSVAALDGPPLTIGARYAIVQPKLRPATWTVTTLEAPRRFAWESRSPGVLVVADHIFVPLSPNMTKVVLSVSYSGLLGSLVGRLYRSITESYLAQEAAALKLVVEGRKATEP